jgi:hypothetical protein
MILQPGAFRTEGLPNYAFRPTGPIPDYDEARKAAAVVYNTLTANCDQAGDPVKGMSLLVDVGSIRGQGNATLVGTRFGFRKGLQGESKAHCRVPGCEYRY